MNNKNNYKDELFNLYSKLLKTAIAIVPISESEDLVHDTLEYFLKREQKYSDHQNLEAITIMKLKNIKIDKWRNKSGTRFEEIDETFIRDNIYENEDDFAKVERIIDFNKLFSKIGEKCREIMNLSLDYSYSEISERLDIERATVGSRLSRCYEELRGLGEHG